MPRRRVHGKRRSEELAVEEYWELLIGPRGEGVSAFTSTTAAREAWRAHRDELLAVANPGTRPQGWWLFEVKGKRQDGEREDEALLRLGVASAADVAAFRASVYQAAGSGRFRYFPAERPELERRLTFGAEYGALTPAERDELLARLSN